MLQRRNNDNESKRADDKIDKFIFNAESAASIVCLLVMNLLAFDASQ
jgi:hypothetical protein